MRVLYVSKALVVAAYRDKLRYLNRHVDVHAVIPERWGGMVPEPDRKDTLVPVTTTRALFHGHNHLHLHPHARRIVRQVRPDLIHIDEEPYSLVTWQWSRLAARANVPCLFFAWQNLHKKLPVPFERVRRGVYRRTSAAIAGTEAAAAVLRQTEYAGPIDVIPQFGVSMERFGPRPEARETVRRRLGLPAHGYVIGYVGRLVPEKGLVELLEAVRTLQRVHLVLVGDGPLRRDLEGRAASTLPGRVHFAGAVPSTGMPDWYAAMDVTVLPSRTTASWVEQFGRCLVESMACGVPVVGSDSGEIPTVIGDAGVVVPEGDVPALAAALDHLRDPARRQTLGAAGRARVRERFSNEAVGRATLGVYRRILGEEPAS